MKRRSWWSRICLRKVFRYYKGRLWCLRFHIPVIKHLGGYGGCDHFGRRREGYNDMSCVRCGNSWEQANDGTPTRGAMMWHWGKKSVKLMESIREENKNKTNEDGTV